MRVAIAQTCPETDPNRRFGSISRTADDIFSILRQNLEDAEHWIEEAAKQKADVVCFPEYFLQGILSEGRQYLSLCSTWLEYWIAEYAKRYSIAITGTIVHGTNDTMPSPPPSDPVSLEESLLSRTEWYTYFMEAGRDWEDDSHYTLINEAFYIDSSGKKVGKYTKKNLWHPEREYLEPGTIEEPLFDTPWGKAGFLICWDLSHPAAAQSLADKGADIIFAPAYWLATDSEPMLSKYNTNPDYELSLVQSLCAARAFETETVLIHTNLGGSRKEGGFMGGSGVWAPLMGKVGGFHKESNDVEEVGIRIIDVDVGVLKDARELYKIREDNAIRNAT